MRIFGNDNRKGTPEAMDGQSNDVYEQMERSKQASQLPGGMAVLYASAPIFSPTSKDPEGAEEVYQILPEEEAVQQGVNSRRLVFENHLHPTVFVQSTCKHFFLRTDSS